MAFRISRRSRRSSYSFGRTIVYLTVGRAAVARIRRMPQTMISSKSVKPLWRLVFRIRFIGVLAAKDGPPLESVARLPVNQYDRSNLLRKVQEVQVHVAITQL